MEQLETQRIILKTSNNGMLVPVIDGYHLHSLHDPLIEAKQLAIRHQIELENNPVACVLGLGFGYHVKSIEEMLSQYHKSFKLFVIEPNLEILNYYQQNNSQTFKIFCDEVKNLFSNQDFLDLLIQKPTIIIHKPSYAVSNTYFDDVLKYRSSKNLSESMNQLSNRFLEKFPLDINNNELLLSDLENNKEIDARSKKFFLFLKSVTAYKPTEN